jgi:putative ABC transport system permease protein
LDADPRPELYLPHAQWTNGGGAIRDMYIVLRTRRDPSSLVTEVRRTIGALDPDLPLTDIKTMAMVLSDSMASRRVSLIVLVTIAAAAASIAAVGLYGVISFAVAQRTRDIGIRRALGATPRAIITIVARQGAPAIVSGVAVGFVGALALTRLMRALLFQVQPADPLTFVSVAALVAIVAVVASYVPARRAIRIDPLTAVRSN